MPQTVIGVFNRVSDARQAEEQLVRSGFPTSNVDVAPKSALTASEETDRDGDEGGAGDRIGRFFRSLFGSDEEAETYSMAARRSDAVVTVFADSTEDAVRAAGILDEAGAIDVDEAAGTSTASAGGFEASATTSTEAPTARVIQEEVHVGKGVVTTGGARLRSRIVERPVEQSVRLREEHVVVERHPVDRPATAEELAAFRPGEVEIVEHAEVPVVSKEARVVEEVSVRKEATERSETVHETVRDTEVEIEEIPAPSTGGGKPTKGRTKR